MKSQEITKISMIHLPSTINGEGPKLKLWILIYNIYCDYYYFLPQLVCAWLWKTVQYTGDHCFEKCQMTDLNVKLLWAKRSLWHFHFGAVISLPLCSLLRRYSLPRCPLSANVTHEEQTSAVDCSSHLRSSSKITCSSHLHTFSKDEVKKGEFYIGE